MPPNIPSGFEIAEEFSVNGDIVTVPVRAGYDGNAPTVLASRQGGRNGKIILLEFSPQVVDPTGALTIAFSLRRNNLPIEFGLTQVPAVMFAQNQRMPLSIILDGGYFDIVAFNSDNTLTPQCQAGWKGYLLRERRLETLQENYIRQQQPMY